jgi:predicted metal-binding protein
MPYIQIRYEDIYFDPKVQEMCVSPAFTCPYYNHTWSCPPVAPYLEKEISTYKEFFLVYSKFDLEKYINEMKIRHPKRSEMRIRNSFYMKNMYHNDLEMEMDKFLDQYQSPYERRLLLYDGSCKVCYSKKAGKCTYDSGKTCRFPDEKRYSMEAVGIEVIRTVIGLKADIEYPSNKYHYRFGLACFK